MSLQSCKNAIILPKDLDNINGIVIYHANHLSIKLNTPINFNGYELWFSVFCIKKQQLLFCWLHALLDIYFNRTLFLSL